MRPVTIKRELFYAIQQGGRIDPKTGRLIKGDDTKMSQIMSQMTICVN